MKEYHIIGIGSIGYTLAKLLVIDRPEIILHLWDKDVVESHNIGFPKNTIGMLKIGAAVEHLGDSVITHNKFATNRELDKYPNKFVIDCTDTKSKYNLKSNIKVSFDGPLLVIADGRSNYVHKDIPFYYVQNKEFIEKAARIVLKSTKSSFNYTGVKKVYHLEKSPKDNDYLLHNSKRKCNKHKLQKGTNIFLPPTQALTKEITAIQKQDIKETYFKISYYNNTTHNYDIVFTPKCSKQDFIKCITSSMRLVPSQEYYADINGHYIDNEVGVVDITIYHMPTAC